VASRVELASGGGLYQLYEPFCLKGAGMDYWYGANMYLMLS
jgi:hypothetical protein